MPQPNGLPSSLCPASHVLCFDSYKSSQDKWKAEPYDCSQRGLRQGDPLSPFLNLICGEALNCGIAYDNSHNKILHPQLTPIGSRVGLLQFADDNLIFIRADKKSRKNLRKVLDLFALEAGQSINRTKSCLMFSQGTSNVDMAMLNHLHHSTQTFQYLGGPISLRHTRSPDSQQIIVKMETKIGSWQGSLLNLREGKSLSNQLWVYSAILDGPSSIAQKSHSSYSRDPTDLLMARKIQREKLEPNCLEASNKFH